MSAELLAWLQIEICTLGIELMPTDSFIKEAENFTHCLLVNKAVLQLAER